VSAAELLELREAFPLGRFVPEMEETTLTLREHRRFLAQHAESIARFKARQQAAFEAERARWREPEARGLPVDAPAEHPGQEAASVPQGCEALTAPVTGSMWQVCVQPGARVSAGDTLAVIESMKMEVPVVAEQPGDVVEVRCATGRTVQAGEAILVIRPRT